MKVGSIVNAANTDLQMCDWVCGAIFKAVGAAQLQAACYKLAAINTGELLLRWASTSRQNFRHPRCWSRPSAVEQGAE
ncbi:Macro domain-containing protein [Desulfitobacterium dichloroeliminans LMG P-21439]|uniref:Macro domain-containing protein n=1 Tax=Desulfitobacterium dichloroeliminans (strain LMG P-21439 / DCA1) TaxID=871963 RepID=L0F570_DESDL|nr:macro domain-containing protein [Desulfitobacterium dichloroeliminans]AGA68068.1 Macro domain-containing protein [Desulfitobacterium dichloroeliminans LMG P-21439]